MRPSIVPSPDPAVQEMMEFLSVDLNNLFTDKGVDASRYGDAVDFQDPITRYESLDGYLFNIKMLRVVFNPEFILHGLWQTGPNEITSRWTMNMELTANKMSPFRAFWDPTLTFTGLSIYTMDDVSGKIVKHVDYWDAIEDQKYLSLEGVGHLVSQLADVKQTPPDVAGPEYMILKKRAEYEVRRYAPYLVAKKNLTDSGSATASSAERQSAFAALREYVAGNNDQGRRLPMTTPVLSDSQTMQVFVAGILEAGKAPAPKDASVALSECPGGVYAAMEFAGEVSQDVVQLKQEELRKQLAADGLAPGVGCTLARYSDPSVLPVLQRNEVLVPLTDFLLLEVEAGPPL